MTPGAVSGGLPAELRGEIVEKGVAVETKKIAMACFVGGAFCCAVALSFAPVYWWLGIIAGMAGGYVSYEFREVRKAIPIALRAAGRESMGVGDAILRSIAKWLARPHPVFYPSLVISATLYAWIAYSCAYPITEYFAKSEETGLAWTHLLLLELAVIAFVPISGLFTLFAYIGAKVGERCYWWPFLLPGNNRAARGTALWLEAQGLQQKPLNYQNFARWFAKGLGLTALFFVWAPWKYLAISVWATLCFLGRFVSYFGRFVWYLFKLIHSEKRMLCAIDGTLGGAASYIWFASSAMSFPEQVMFVIFGGLFGAAFGVANWEIVSKRILHVSISA